MVRIMMLIDIWLHLQIAITRNMFPQNISQVIVLLRIFITSFENDSTDIQSFFGESGIFITFMKIAE